MQDSLIVLLDGARNALAKAESLEDIKGIRDKAEVLRQYAAQAGAGLEAQNRCAEIKLRAERKAGEVIPDTVKRGRREKGDSVSPLLEDLGVSKKQSSRWQQAASVPEAEFEAHIARTKEGAQELTSASVRRLAERLTRDRRRENGGPPIPDGKYRVIYADPPWKYGDEREGLESYGSAEGKYPTMSVKELCELGVEGLAHENAVLFLWVPSPLLPDAFQIIGAWGFSYKSSFVWDKVGHNFGHYNSVRHEFLLICTRGSCLPDSKELQDSVVSIEKSRTHSQKPEFFRMLIDEMYADGPRIELFARKESEGWDAWGNEVKQYAVG
tara:strand:- start:2289 stop:3266 length:978 start_codon:yes stop_codon:yes gene_type:complete